MMTAETERTRPWFLTTVPGNMAGVGEGLVGDDAGDHSFGRVAYPPDHAPAAVGEDYHGLPAQSQTHRRCESSRIEALD